MNTKQIKTLYVFVMISIGSVLIGLGTSFFIGWGVFFLMWALAGIIELENM
jgi:hypothetical protein